MKRDVRECKMGRSDPALLEKFEKLFDLFFAAGEVTEIRALNLSGKGPWEGWARGQVSGYFDNPKKFAEAACKLEQHGKASGIYFIPNPVKPALLARAANRLKAADVATTDKDIACLRWLLIDTDAERPTGISATGEEEKAALKVRDQVAASLAERGWPSPIKARSGNGGHLLYRLPDLEPTQENTDLLKRCLQALSAKFTSPAVKIDEKVFNPARIWKLYGTTSRKGDNTTERPYRRSEIQ
jgi:hypothetical protein